MDKVKKIITLSFLSFILVFGLSACSLGAKKTNNLIKEKTGSVEQKEDNQKDVVVATSTEEIGPEILETDIDTSDWAEYKSDEFGYSFKLPKGFVFLPEGANVSKINYNPKSESFQVGKIINKNQKEYLFHFSIIETDIDSFIRKREKDTGLKAPIIKIFSKNGIDYYRYPQQSKLSSVPSVIYKNSIVIIFGHQESFDDTTYRAILSTVNIF